MKLLYIPIYKVMQRRAFLVEQEVGTQYPNIPCLSRWPLKSSPSRAALRHGGIFKSVSPRVYLEEVQVLPGKKDKAGL